MVLLIFTNDKIESLHETVHWPYSYIQKLAELRREEVQIPTSLLHVLDTLRLIFIYKKKKILEVNAREAVA